MKNNLKNLVSYEEFIKDKYEARNKSDFCAALGPEQVVEFALLCDVLGLELVQKRVDYYTEREVGSLSPYYERPVYSDFEEDGQAFEVNVSDFDFASFSRHFSVSFDPVQLELPYD